MHPADKPEPQYVRIGWLVKHIGLSAETWRRLAAQKKVRCLRPGGPKTYRVFDVKSCRDYLAGNIDAIQSQSNTQATRRERQAAFHRRFAAKNGQGSLHVPRDLPSESARAALGPEGAAATQAAAAPPLNQGGAL